MGAGPDGGLDPAARRWLLVVAGVCLLGVLALNAWLHLIGPLPGERAVTRLWEHWRPYRVSGDFNSALELFDALATPWVAVGTVAAAAWVVWENDGRRWALLVAAASGVVVLTAVLKHLLGPTPLWEEVKGFGRNYPSGHVAYATALFGALALVTWRHRQQAMTVVLLALIPLMAITRVLAASHLPSDTIGGFLCGVAWLAAVVALLAPDDALLRRR